MHAARSNNSGAWSQFGWRWLSVKPFISDREESYHRWWFRTLRSWRSIHPSIHSSILPELIELDARLWHKQTLKSLDRHFSLKWNPKLRLAGLGCGGFGLRPLPSRTERTEQNRTEQWHDTREGICEGISSRDAKRKFIADPKARLPTFWFKQEREARIDLGMVTRTWQADEREIGDLKDLNSVRCTVKEIDRRRTERHTDRTVDH